MPLPVTQLIFATFIPSIIAKALYTLLRVIFKQRAALIFQGLALFVLLLSLGGPLNLPVTLANKIILILMHLVTTSAIVWALTLSK